MLPAISTEDCLFAELDVDPGMNGCQSYEATDFLLSKRQIDPSSVLVLWQAGRLGEERHRPDGYSMAPLALLSEKLAVIYKHDHICTIYQASPFPDIEPSRSDVRIADLPKSFISPGATLYVPPSQATVIDEDMKSRLAKLLASDVDRPTERRRGGTKAKRRNR
jgi:hypothetical protein